MLSFYDICLISLYSFTGTSLGTILAVILFDTSEEASSKAFERIYFFAISSVSTVAVGYSFINYL